MDPTAPQDNPNQKQNRRFPSQKSFRRLEFVFRVWLVFTCLFVVASSLVMLFSEQPSLDWRVSVAMLVIAVAALPVGFLVIRVFFTLINNALSKRNSPPANANGERNQAED